MLRPLGERWTVTRSLRPELSVGTEMVAIEGAPMAEVLAQRRAFLCASNDRAAENLLFYRRHLFPDRIVARTRSRRRRSWSRRAAKAYRCGDREPLGAFGVSQC